MKLHGNYLNCNLSNYDTLFFWIILKFNEILKSSPTSHSGLDINLICNNKKFETKPL